MSLDISLNYQVEEDQCVTVFDANITHNLTEMADQAGLYKTVWRGEGVEKAGDMVDKLRTGIADMKNDHYHYKQFDSPNGWGSYDDFVPWLESLLEACVKYPNASVEQWR